MVVVVDTCSLHRLVVYYLPFDKDGALLSLLEKQFTSRQMMMTDLVYTECQRMDKGIILERMPFLKDAGFKKGLIKTEDLVPNKKLLNYVNEQFTIRSKFNNLPIEQQQIQKEAYFRSGDFSLVYCAYHTKQGLSTGLFPEDLMILTDESTNENGPSCFKKVPNCCKLLGVDSINIQAYLEDITEGKLRFILQQEKE
jgi:hypothetical protein